jgi:asparagine synthase (glutamine-hydrolysing)
MDAYGRAFGVRRIDLQARVARRLAFWAMRQAPGYERAAPRARRALFRRNRWFTSELADQAPDQRVSPTIDLEEAQRHSVDSAPLPLLLRIEDRNSMAHGVEVRVPFLDFRLVSYGLSLPIDWRISGPWNKHGLRAALRGRIPETVRTRQDKMGFPMPTGRWFARELYEPVRDILGSNAARSRGLYHTETLLRELDRGRGAEVANHAVLFRAVNVELWLSMLTNRSEDTASALLRSTSHTLPTGRRSDEHVGAGPLS